MLGRSTLAAAMMLSLAGVCAAQIPETDPPPVEPRLGTTGPQPPASGPVPVLTLAQKEELRKFCTQSANKTHSRCKGFAPKIPAAPTTE